MLKHIPIEDLKRTPFQLRPVKKSSLDYYMLKESIEREGLLVPLLVRPVENGFEVVDGSHRFEILQDLGQTSAPCHIRELTDKQVLYVQVQANANVVETQPVDFARRLWRIINIDNAMTVNELAHELHRPVTWVKRMLGLVFLDKSGEDALHKGKISVAHAVEIAKLPVDAQKEVISLAGTLPSGEFLDEIRKEVRKRRIGWADHKKHLKAAEKEQNAVKYKFRKFKEVVNELENPILAGLVLDACQAKTVVDGWNAALQWVLTCDSYTKQKATNFYEQ